MIWNAQTALIHDGLYGALQLTDLSGLRTQLNTYLTALDATAVTKVQELVEAWDDISLNTVRQDAGASGDVTGLTADPDRARQIIQERFILYVPVMRWWELEKLKAGNAGANSAFIPRVS